MPDIWMCHGDGCPKKLRNTCYRYTAKPSDIQSYFMTPPYDEKEKSCKHHWKRS